MLCNSLTSKSEVSIKTEAGPSACQVSFKDLNCERQPITFEFGCFQNHDGVVDRRLTLAED